MGRGIRSLELQVERGAALELHVERGGTFELQVEWGETRGEFES